MTHIEDQLSPFLQFCKDSPIDWYPWDFDSIEEARKVNKPIFLSIGYAVCYWCFRMEKEVFSHPDVAQFFNQNFLCIKLDKDEHPHVDKLYMELSQILLQSVTRLAFKCIFNERFNTVFFYGICSSSFIGRRDWYG